MGNRLGLWLHFVSRGTVHGLSLPVRALLRYSPEWQSGWRMPVGTPGTCKWPGRILRDSLPLRESQTAHGRVPI